VARGLLREVHDLDVVARGAPWDTAKGLGPVRTAPEGDPVVGLYPSSFNRRVKKHRCYLEPLRREILPELVGEPETLLVDSTLLEVLHPRQVSQSAGWGSPSAGAAWVRWSSFSVYGVKLHLLCSTAFPSPTSSPLPTRSGHLPDRRTH
jgi:hypothetical protein